MTRVLLLLVVFAGVATAQEHTFTLSPKANSPLDQRLRARVVFTDASRRLGAYGWVEVDLRNPLEQGHTIGMRLESSADATVNFLYQRNVRLEAGEQFAVR